ncbi:MAG: hypothetical protein AAFW83_06915 [Pseudomonadota bacterium]
MQDQVKKLEDRLRQLEQRTPPPIYPSLDQVADVLSAARVYRNMYASTAPGHEKLKEFIRHLPREGRKEIEYLAKLVSETENEKPIS